MANSHAVFAALAGCLFLLVTGVLCLFWPESIRNYALRVTPEWNPLLGWMRSGQYVWSLRITGVLALAGFLLVTVGVLKIAL